MTALFFVRDGGYFAGFHRTWVSSYGENSTKTVIMETYFIIESECMEICSMNCSKNWLHCCEKTVIKVLSNELFQNF